MKINDLLILLRADLARLSPPQQQGDVALIKWRNLFNPRLTPVVMIRLARFCYLLPWLRPLSLLFTWLNLFLFGIECTAKCDVGPGLLLPHTSGTVIGAGNIGANVTIFQGVTLGALELDMGFDPSRRPILSDGVVVGAGAKILGGISVGQGAVIGANAVVLQSIPTGGVAVGIPAKVIKIVDERAS
jgi:serine O-acetyltransferase